MTTRTKKKAKAPAAAAAETAPAKPVAPEDSPEQVQLGWTGRQLLRLEEALRKRMSAFLHAARKQGLRVCAIEDANKPGATEVDTLLLDDQARAIQIHADNDGDALDLDSQNREVVAVMALAQEHGLSVRLTPRKRITFTVAEE